MSEGPKCFQYGFECDELDNACSKIKDLERQLDEAREKIDIQKGHLELAISISDDSNIKLL